MFTGIVQTKGHIAAITPQSGGVRLKIDHAGWQPHGISFRLGDSICVSGVCLTLVDFDDRNLSFDVITETLSLTTLNKLAVGDEVNLEPSLTPSTPMGGHFVQGHIDGVGSIVRVKAGEDWRITIRPPEQLMAAIIPKGSIAISGVSLTIAKVTRYEFEVALIPTTLDLTTLGSAAPGQAVNLETDIVSKTIIHWLARQKEHGDESGGVTMDQLRDAGLVDGS